MKAAMYYGPGDIRVEEIATPRAGEEGVVLRVRACGICQLIDVPHYKMSFSLMDVPPKRHTDPLPKTSGIVLGHEFSGEVVEVSSKVSAVKERDRIYGVIWNPCGYCDFCQAGDYEHCPFSDAGGRVVNGAMAEYLLFPKLIYPSVTSDKIVKLPEGISYRDGALIEPLRLGIGLASKAKAGDTVVVFGQEVVGLSALTSLKRHGAAKVITCDVSQKRLQASREAGADLVLDGLKDDILGAVMEATSGKGADVVIESSCRPENLQHAVNVVKPFGDVWLGTYYTAGPFFDASYQYSGMVSMNITQKPGINLHCAWGTLGPWKPMLGEALEMLQSGQVTADKCVTHVFPLEKVKEAFEVAMNPHESIKVMLEP